MYELIKKINDIEIRFIVTIFYSDLILAKLYKDDIDFKNTPIKGYDYDKAIEDFKKVLKFIIKNQKSS